MVLMLEASLEKAIEKKSSASNAAGICVADKNGLPLLAKGTLKPEVAGISVHLLTLAAQLDPAAAQQVSPVVVISGDHNQVTFSKEKTTVVAVHTTH